MSITGLFIVLFIVTLALTLTANKSQKGGSPSGWSAINIPQSPSSIYSQQFNELDNVDNVLNRPVVPGNTFINNMQPKDDNYENLGELPKVFDSHVKREQVSNATKVLVESNQPYFLDNSLIVNYYGKPHYWDWRYPRQPVPIEFAENPDKFIDEHPEEYPSYLIKSRNYSDLQPYDPAL